jgi:hypothetical protein
MQIVGKHDGSRIVQACLKYGNNEQRKQIIELFSNKSILELAKSKYGHFLAIKMIEFLDKAQFNKILTILMQNFEHIGTTYVDILLLFCHSVGRSTHA